MGKTIDYISGELVGECAYLADAGLITYGMTTRRVALFKCKCGKEFTACLQSVKGKFTRSCGCYRKEALLKREIVPTPHNKKFINSGHPIQSVWRNMLKRCTDAKDKDYRHYGGRGIVVSDRWKNSFDAFFEDMGDRPSKQHSLERIDNNGNYCLQNCRWATTKEQSRNKRNNHLLNINGIEKCLIDVAKEYNINFITLICRLKKGLPIDEALKPARKPILIRHEGKEQTISDWSKETGITVDTIRRRLNKGWNTEAIFPGKILHSTNE